MNEGWKCPCFFFNSYSALQLLNETLISSLFSYFYPLSCPISLTCILSHVSGDRVLCANVDPQTNVEDRLTSYFRNHTGLSSCYLSSMKKRVNLLKSELWKTTYIIPTTFLVKPQASCKLETPWCYEKRKQNDWWLIGELYIHVY